MNARNAEFQRKLQEKNDEINRLRRELRKVQRGEVHIVSTCIRQQNESTVLTRTYAPPFCWLGLATSMGGAYN